MFGNITKIDDKIIKVRNLYQTSLINMIGYYTIFEDTSKIVGEIVFVDESNFDIIIIGEIHNNRFISGVNNYPNINAKCRMLYKNELEYIIGSQDIKQPTTLYLGKSNIFKDYNITVNVNDFFSNHFAVIGNTGSGKSCGVARIIQNLFSDYKINPTRSHIVLLDVYGEYKSAISKINKPGINTKNYAFKNNSDGDELLKIPPYLLEVDDLALLLNLKDNSLINILEKTLRYVKIFKGDPDTCRAYKNGIIATTLLDILLSGKKGQQISDQAIAMLSKFNTEDINLETLMIQPGYNRTIRHCLYVDPNGKIAALELLVDYLTDKANIDVNNLELGFVEYTMQDLYDTLEFVMVSEGILSSEGIFEKLNVIKTRLHTIINGDAAVFFEYYGIINRENYVYNLFKNNRGENVQLIDINFNGIDDRMAKVIVKILCKMFYKFSTSLTEKGSYPINIIIEEAHRYIMDDNDIDIIGYNVFDKIAKEGRKYGVLLGIITQRISELSPNALSQCSNFIIFRMYYPDDIKIVSSISSNVTMDAIEKVKSLKPGSALLFGNAFKIPLITTFDIPNPMPTSINVNIVERWY